MRSSVASSVLALAAVTAAQDYTQPGEIPPWHPPTADDFRGPCPMMNTLANHGFLPHDGRGLTKDVVVSGLTSGLDFDPVLAGIMFDKAVIANPEPNATFFTLDHLNQHNVLEHDASLSRTDAFFGNNHVFNETIFAETRRYWTGPVLDVTMLANSKIARQIESKSFNPTYRFTADTENFSLGEVAAPIVAFGDLDAGTVDQDLVVYFFENERFPTELGWTPRGQVVKAEAVLRLANMISAAGNLITGSNSTASLRRRGGVHFDFSVQGQQVPE